MTSTYENELVNETFMTPDNPNYILTQDVTGKKDGYEFTIGFAAKMKIRSIQEAEALAGAEDVFLKVSIISGGCQGYQYYYEMTNQIDPEDLLIRDLDGQKICTVDFMSLTMMDGGKLDFIANIGGSYFKVLNKNQKTSCGCGSSFSQ